MEAVWSRVEAGVRDSQQRLTELRARVAQHRTAHADAQRAMVSALSPLIAPTSVTNVDVKASEAEECLIIISPGEAADTESMFCANEQPTELQRAARLGTQLTHANIYQIMEERTRCMEEQALRYSQQDQVHAAKLHLAQAWACDVLPWFEEVVCRNFFSKVCGRLESHGARLTSLCRRLALDVPRYTPVCDDVSLTEPSVSSASAHRGAGHCGEADEESSLLLARARTRAESPSQGAEEPTGDLGVSSGEEAGAADVHAAREGIALPSPAPDRGVPKGKDSDAYPMQELWRDYLRVASARAAAASTACEKAEATQTTASVNSGAVSLEGQPRTLRHVWHVLMHGFTNPDDRDVPDAPVSQGTEPASPLQCDGADEFLAAMCALLRRHRCASSPTRSLDVPLCIPLASMGDVVSYVRALLCCAAHLCRVLCLCDVMRRESLPCTLPALPAFFYADGEADDGWEEGCDVHDAVGGVEPSEVTPDKAATVSALRPRTWQGCCTEDLAALFHTLPCVVRHLRPRETCVCADATGGRDHRAEVVPPAGQLDRDGLAVVSRRRLSPAAPAASASLPQLADNTSPPPCERFAEVASVYISALHVGALFGLFDVFQRRSHTAPSSDPELRDVGLRGGPWRCARGTAANADDGESVRVVASTCATAPLAAAFRLSELRQVELLARQQWQSTETRLCVARSIAAAAAAERGRCGVDAAAAGAQVSEAQVAVVERRH